MNEYESVRKLKYVGFADFYLGQCSEKQKSNVKIDKQIYTRLVEIDTRLGTTASEQLFECIFFTLRLDIIKVSF